MHIKQNQIILQMRRKNNDYNDIKNKYEDEDDDYNNYYRHDK